jgi:hypothetical protein
MVFTHAMAYKTNPGGIGIYHKGGACGFGGFLCFLDGGVVAFGCVITAKC